MSKTFEEKLNEVGLKIPSILFPREGINLSKFACIAADQFTQDPAYWDRVKKYVGDEPSTFNLIYPEAYMEQELATNKDNFENVLDKWIKLLREIKYNNTIILFGTRNSKKQNALPMTDEREINDLISVAGIKGNFYDIGNKSKEEKNALIDNLIETSYEDAKNNMNKKDCIIF